MLTELLAATPFLAIFLYVFAGAALRSTSEAQAKRISMLVGGLAFGLAAVSLPAVLMTGAVESGRLGCGELFLQSRLDNFSAVMFTLVAFVGLIVLRYSHNYLDGDRRQQIFLARLCRTLGAVCLLVTSGSLVQLVAAWIATSYALHTLLLHFPERRAAQMAARKKYIAARTGDLFLLVGSALLFASFETTSISAISEASRAGGGGAQAGVGAVLLALAAMLKSAQFPTHGWLVEVMETPTPVSALLHAGVINAGGFLMIRFADVITASTTASTLLIVVGGFTALVCSIAMLTQSSIKVSLAYSTAAQMGFMLLQCGFGAFAAAALHIVAHSLYKAHAFLSSGETVIAKPKAPYAYPNSKLQMIASLVIALAIYGGVGALFGFANEESTAVLALGAIFTMGVFLFLVEGGSREHPIFAYSVGISLGVAVAYFTLQLGAGALLADVAPEPAAPGVIMSAFIGLAVFSFAIVAMLQLIGPGHGSKLKQHFYVHAQNGFYANAIANRLVRAFSVPSTTSSPAPRG